MSDLLEYIGMEQYTDAFYLNLWSSPDLFCVMTEDDVRRCGVDSASDRRKVRAITIVSPKCERLIL